MNSVAPRQSRPRLQVERRRRWKKRREFDRAFRLAGVNTGLGPTIDPHTYRHVNVCDYTFQNTRQSFAGDSPAKQT